MKFSWYFKKAYKKFSSETVFVPILVDPRPSDGIIRFSCS